MTPSELREILNARLREADEDAVLRRMGYTRVQPGNRERLHAVLGDEWLGLEGGFDFKFDSAGFLAALCEAVEVSADECRAVIASVREHIAAFRAAFQPFVWVDTGFRRADRPGTPIFVLAALESRRNLVLSGEARLADREAVIREARARVRAHYRETGGELKVWGTIRRYVLFLGKGDSLVLDTEGELQGEGPPAPTSRAGVFLR